MCLKRMSVEEEDEEEEEVNVGEKEDERGAHCLRRAGGSAPRAALRRAAYRQASCPVAQRVLVSLGLTGVLARPSLFRHRERYSAG